MPAGPGVVDDVPIRIEHRDRQVGVLGFVGLRGVAHFDRVIAAGDRDDRRVVEEFRHALDIERGRGHDEFEIRPPRQEALEHAEQQIDIEGSLVRLVDDDGVVAPEGRIGRELGEQQSIRHQHQPRAASDLIGETHAETHRSAHRLRELVGDARRQGAGREPAWLGVRDEPLDSAAHFQAVLRQLSALPRAGIARDDEYPMATQGVDDLLAPRGNRQIGIVSEDQRREDARTGRPRLNRHV